MIDYLERHGYVIRQPHPSDGRGKIVLLIERGWGCIRATEEVFSDIERRWTDLVGPERMAQVRSDLRRFVYALGDGELPSRLRPVW
jgi:DNA-binding MarR family transcriptional regulator